MRIIQYPETVCLVCVYRVVFKLKSTKTYLVCLFSKMVVENCFGERVLQKMIDLMCMRERVILESK